MSYEQWRISYQSSEQAARAAYAEAERMKRALVLVAPYHQGGHSAAGEIIADALRIPFPIRCANLPYAVQPSDLPTEAHHG